MHGRGGRNSDVSHRQPEHVHVDGQERLQGNPLVWNRNSPFVYRTDAKHSAMWDAAELRLGADGKTRPVEPFAFPLAYGVPARVGRLRGYGNAVVPQLAALFLEELFACTDFLRVEKGD